MKAPARQASIVKRQQDARPGQRVGGQGDVAGDDIRLGSERLWVRIPVRKVTSSSLPTTVCSSHRRDNVCGLTFCNGFTPTALIRSIALPFPTCSPHHHNDVFYLSFLDVLTSPPQQCGILPSSTCSPHHRNDVFYLSFLDILTSPPQQCDSLPSSTCSPQSFQ